MLKIGLVGVGGIARVHIPAWDSMENAELTALCDIRPEQLEAHKDKHCYTDFDEMLEKEQFDIVDICLPTYLHTEYSVMAMEKGINVICEKPASLLPEDVERLYSTAKKNNVKFMIAQVLRFWREFDLIKQLYESKQYGMLLSGDMSRLGSYPSWSWDNWMMDEKRSGLVPFDLHIHDLDFLVYAFGTPEKSTSFRNRRPEQDYIHAVYEYDGFFVTADASWYASPYPFQSNFRFQFENAVVAYENNKLTVYERGGKVYSPFDESSEISGTANALSLPKTNAYLNEIVYFADCVEKNKAPDMVKPGELEEVIKILRSL